ncbi:MAG: helix-turn-helix transcriptional regulator [Pseudomonadota bacterium]
MSKDNFCKNLRFLCNERASISQVCRDIGINRQQFNSYLSGRSKPSGHNLTRISAYFEVAVVALDDPHEEFCKARGAYGADSFIADKDRFWNMANHALAGDRNALRKHLGYYHSYFVSPQVGEKVMRALVCLFESEGRFFTKSIERSNQDGPHALISKYDGVATCLNERIFVVEFESLSRDSLVETILYPSYRRKLTYLSGLTLGSSSFRHRAPFATPVVWRFLGRTIDTRKSLEACGLLDLNSRDTDPVVRSIFSKTTEMLNLSMRVRPY